MENEEVLIKPNPTSEVNVENDGDKNKNQSIFKSKFFILFVGISFLIAFLIGGFMLAKNNSNKEVACNLEAMICPDGSSVGRSGPNCEFSPCPTSSPGPITDWKTYTDPKYKFSFQYPAKGKIYLDGSEKSIYGECGKAIITTTPDEKNSYSLLVDNYFYILVKPWSGTISQYMAQEKASDLYETKIISNSGAEEAIELVKLKPDETPSWAGYPPLAYFSHLYLKENNLFIIAGLQNNGNFGGCNLPEGTSSTNANKFEGWNVGDTFKFTQ